MGDLNKEETFQSVVKMPWALLPSSFFISQVSSQSSFQSFSPCTTVLNYLPVRVLTRLLLATASPECRAILVERCRQPHWAQQMNNKHYKCRRRSQQVKRLKIRPACQIVATYLHSAQKIQFLVKRAVIVNKWDGKREFICIHIRSECSDWVYTLIEPAVFSIFMQSILSVFLWLTLSAVV